MTAIAERIDARQIDRTQVDTEPSVERVWQHPDRLIGNGATLRSDLSASRTIRPDELSRINLGYVEAVRWALNGHRNETAENQGFQIRRGRKLDEIKVTHRGPFDQRTVEGTIRRGYGPLETSKFTLFEANVQLGLRERAGRYLRSVYNDIQQSLHEQETEIAGS